MLGKCFISKRATSRTFDGLPIDKEVLDFARNYRDALSKDSQRRRTVRGVLIAFQEMMKFGHTWESLRKKLIDEMKDKGISLDE